MIQCVIIFYARIYCRIIVIIIQLSTILESPADISTEVQSQEKAYETQCLHSNMNDTQLPLTR